MLYLPPTSLSSLNPSQNQHGTSCSHRRTRYFRITTSDHRGGSLPVTASMVRVVSRTAILAHGLWAAKPSGILGRRHHHTRRRAAEVLEVDAAGPSTSAEGGAMTRRLEEAIDRAMARMAEPDWALFRPGTSYYAPPRPAGAALGLLALVSHGGGMGPLPRALSGDEARAVASASRGYPCSTYFIDGHFPDEVEGSRQDANPAEAESNGRD